MGLHRSALALVALGPVALATAVPAGAKENVEATLATSIPLDAPAGIELVVAWRLFSVDENGRRQPFGANGVFVRLLSASGAPPTEGVAPMGTHATGGYEATVVVPQGGIRDIELGLVGWASDATGTRRSDVIFPIRNDPIRTPAPLPSPAAESPAPGGWDVSSWALAGVASLLCVLVVSGSALRRRRRRDATGHGQVARG